MKYRMVGGLTAEIPHFPDRELAATLAAAKVVKAAYARVCKTDKNPALWKIKEEWVDFVNALKAEQKRRKETATPVPKTDVNARPTEKKTA